ncbi:death-on-curing protein [Thiohalobacter sp. COW1]|uniref:type II toxin-antitoxin system death-on-curing family toxin n=1 Tax=Thiohalobacter sp. COW1 TaxID=2795687 RepID=UPI001916AA39|nr:type II toxin-antitoxin system death-on-curing family toxin [Thiohalobacter sp. COW1]BCO31173.1 death-on-curing protein [Thiohalobacter sp. COW1]
MSGWRWIPDNTLTVCHTDLLKYGGTSGLIDHAKLDSAMTRASNLAAYGEPDLAELAAAYGYGVTRNHPLPDGNKRAALVAIDIFLQLNGQELIADEAEVVRVIQALAAGNLEEPELADWIRAHMQNV